MKTINILLKGGQKHVDFIKSDGKKATKAFPATTSREKIDEAIKKLDSQPEAPASPKAAN